MEVEEIREYCLSKKAVTEAFPFEGNFGFQGWR